MDAAEHPAKVVTQSHVRLLTHSLCSVSSLPLFFFFFFFSPLFLSS